MLPSEDPIEYYVTPDAHVLLVGSDVEVEALVARYLDGDLGDLNEIVELVNGEVARSASLTGFVGRYVLGPEKVIIIRRRQSGTVFVMDGASILASLESSGFV